MKKEFMFQAFRVMMKNYDGRGDKWERKSTVEFFSKEKKLLFSGDAGVRIHGNFSRTKPQKSLRLYFRDEYGTEKIRYPFFIWRPYSEFHRLILRTTDTYSSTCFFKDELAAILLRETENDYQEFMPSLVFINGEYWGIHNLRERLDKHYLSSLHNADPESVTILGASIFGDETVEGSWDEYNQLIDFVKANDLSLENNYNYVLSQIDIVNFIDYNIAHIYFANFDWPRNNVRFWKSPGGKWRWLFFDCDYCFSDIENNLFHDIFSRKEEFEKETLLLRSLLNNPDFRELFYSRFYFHLLSGFEPSKVLAHVKELRETYEPMAPEHIRRWGVPENPETWEMNIREIENFVIRRPAEMVLQLEKVLGPVLTVNPNPASEFVRPRLMMYSENISYEIIDLQGRVILTFHNTEEISVSELPAGTYILKARAEGFIFTTRFIRI